MALPTAKELLEAAHAKVKAEQALKEQQALVPTGRPPPSNPPPSNTGYTGSMLARVQARAAAGRSALARAGQPTATPLTAAQSREAAAAKQAADMLKARNLELANASGRPRVGFLLDRSGSMAIVKSQTIAGFNDFVNRMRRFPAVVMTFWQFDGDVDQVPRIIKVFEALPIMNVPLLTLAGYAPEGGTPLIDSAIMKIRAMEESLQGAPADTPVVIVIQTDGGDTSGKPWETLKRLVQAKQRQGWQFMFLGAALDAYLLGADMGIDPEATMSYDTDPETTRVAFEAAANAALSYLEKKKPKATFTPTDRQLAGDKFAPPKLLK